MTTYQQRLAYNFVEKSRDNLIKSLEWIDKIESEKGTLLISQGRKLSEIYKNIEKINIELNKLLKNISDTIDE